MKIKFLKKIEILSITFDVVWDKTHNGGAFSNAKSEIVVGTKDYHKDPVYTFGVLSHEILECIFLQMGARYENPRVENTYLFNFNHQTFENALEIHTQVLSKFIKP
jgi:hypothetical protein